MWEILKNTPLKQWWSLKIKLVQEPASPRDRWVNSLRADNVTKTKQNKNKQTKQNSSVCCENFKGVLFKLMGAMASHTISLAMVNSTVYSGADQRKHQSSAPVTRKKFPFHDVIMQTDYKLCQVRLQNLKNAREMIEHVLTHRGRDKMVATLQTKCSYSFPLNENFGFQIKYQWYMFHIAFL